MYAIRSYYENGYLGFIVRRLYIRDQPPLEARPDPFFQPRDFPGKFIGGNDDLLVCIVQGVERVKKFFLSSFLTA